MLIIYRCRVVVPFFCGFGMKIDVKDFVCRVLRPEIGGHEAFLSIAYY